MPAKSPKHIAIIMDGNGRWAKRRLMPRIAGHRAGLDSLKKIVRACSDLKIPTLTVFAFSSENWHRPKTEIKALMELFSRTLQNEITELHKHQVRLSVLGDLHAFSSDLQDQIQAAERLTAGNVGLHLNIAANYGGRWDILQAAKKLASRVNHGEIELENITEKTFSKLLVTGELDDPDLFIRTSGEQRMSNFLLWQLSYTELVFSDKYWPDFEKSDLEQAISLFAKRKRRYGHTDEQLEI